MYAIEFSFTQSIIGEAVAKSEDEIREGLIAEFGDAPDFKIVKVELLKENTEEQLSLSLVPPTNSVN